MKRISDRPFQPRFPFNDRCGRCDGLGFEWVRVYSKSRLPRRGAMRCGVCLGTGEVAKSVGLAGVQNVAAE